VVVENLQGIAAKYNGTCSLTLEQLEACGLTNTEETHAKNRFSAAEIVVPFRGLFWTEKIGLSTSLIWLSWLLIGLAYPLFQVFLPTYLASRGAVFGVTSAYITWRNYTLVNFSSIWGPVLAGVLATTRLGRRYTMVVGALSTSQSLLFSNLYESFCSLAKQCLSFSHTAKLRTTIRI
jgi:hypothetical protein